MMVRAKRIYILIIKLNKLFSFFSSRCFLKEKENMFPVFLSSYQNTHEILLFLGHRSFIENKDTNSSDKHVELAHFDYDLTFHMYMYSTYIFKSNQWNLKYSVFFIVKPSFSFTNVKTITIPAIFSVNNSGLLWTINTVLVRKVGFYASSALKNDLQVNTRVEFVHTRFQPFSSLVALQT